MAATSSGVSIRPIGILATIAARDSSLEIPCISARRAWIAWVMSVSTTPGQMALTLTPYGASVSAADRTTLRIPALLAAYAAWVGRPPRAETELSATIASFGSRPSIDPPPGSRGTSP